MSGEGQLEREHLPFFEELQCERGIGFFVCVCWLNRRSRLRHGPDITSETKIRNLEFEDLRGLHGDGS